MWVCGKNPIYADFHDGSYVCILESNHSRTCTYNFKCKYINQLYGPKVSDVVNFRLNNSNLSEFEKSEHTIQTLVELRKSGL